MGDVVEFPVVHTRYAGNGAREALTEIGIELPATYEDAERWADWLLAELWVRGFKAVPLDPDDERFAG